MKEQILKHLKYIRRKHVSRVGGTKCKQIAMRDISEECGEGKFYNQNYITKESIVMGACKCKMKVYSINTMIL
jgi:hypothetical protein